MAFSTRFIINNLKRTNEITSRMLFEIKKTKPKSFFISRNEISEINIQFTLLDNIVSELFFQIGELNRKQTLKDDTIYYKQAENEFREKHQHKRDKSVPRSNI